MAKAPKKKPGQGEGRGDNRIKSSVNQANFEVAPNPHAEEYPDGLPVKAIVLGIYEDRRWLPGQQFRIAHPSHFSHVWMEAIGWEPPADKMDKRHGSLPPAPEPEDHHGQGKHHLTGTKQKNYINPLGGEKETARPSATSDPGSVGHRRARAASSKPTGSRNVLGDD